MKTTPDSEKVPPSYGPPTTNRDDDSSLAMMRLLYEKRLTFAQLARREAVSLPTIWRWASRGCRGAILESLTIGARRYTSAEAYARFAAACTAVSQGQHLSADRLKTAAATQRAHEQAERELDDAGL